MHRRTFLATGSSAALAGFSPVESAAQGPRQPIGYLRTNWSRDPFARGSYSFIAKGARRRDIRALGKPIDDKIFFAGEATHPDYNSTVHAALESGRIAAGHISRTSAHRIAVIGAGFAGLAAATELHASGHAVTLLEARDRIGGRVHTADLNGIPLDLGASWIHGTRDNPLTDIAQKAQASTATTDDAYVARDGTGRRLAEKDEPDWIESVVEMETAFGAARDQINLLAYAFDSDYDGPEVIFPKGYAQLLQEFDPGPDLRLSQPVSHIRRTPSGLSVTTPGGLETFDAVLVTIPLGVLKSGDITFDPPLPDAKQRAIARLGMGLLDKLYLQFDNVFWEHDPTWIYTTDTGLPPGQMNLWLNLFRFTGHPVLAGFHGGPAAHALSDLEDASLVATALEVLGKAYPA